MDQNSVKTSASPEVHIEQIKGSLQVKGWDRPEVSINGNPDDIDFKEQDDVVFVSCRGSCTLRLPYGASVRVGEVYGEARFKLLEDQLVIGTVHGPLILREVGETLVEQVQGELLAKHVAGGLRVESVLGNAIARDVQGQFMVDKISGNLDLRDIEGDILAQASGNARLRLSTMMGSQYNLSARGNVNCRLPEDASLRLLLSSGAQSIKVRLPSESKVYQGTSTELVLNGGAVEMHISAGGNLMLSSEEIDPEDIGDSDSEFGEDIAGISDEFNQQIAQQIESQIEAQMEAMNRQLQEQLNSLSMSYGKAGLSPDETEEMMQRARESSERAASRAQEKMRRTQERLERKLEVARRRSELRAQAAGRRSESRDRQGWGFSFGGQQPVQPPNEAATEEERLMILRMLEQKKISLAEAEALLSALEGKE